MLRAPSHQEFLEVSATLRCGVCREVKLHVVMDNYGTHKPPECSAGSNGRPLHSAFCPNQFELVEPGERWFGELTGKRIRRGVFVSVEDLQKAIEEFLAAWNSAPKLFVLDGDVDSIVEKLNRCKQTLERIKPGCTRPRMRKNKENTPVVCETLH